MIALNRKEALADIGYVWAPLVFFAIALGQAFQFMMQGKVSIALWPLLAGLWALNNVLFYGLDKAAEIRDKERKTAEGDTE